MAPPTLAAALHLLLLTSLTTAQQISTLTPEVHPTLLTQTCTLASGCTTHATLLVADALAHPMHSTADPSVSCLPLNATLCPDTAACAAACALSGVNYASLGVLTSSTALTLRQYLFNGSTHVPVSPRLYLLDPTGDNYQPLSLLNRELTFSVDVSALACGMNGALYLSEMDLSGSRSAALNPAGARYGTGYCDAQCFNTTAFINGVANIGGVHGACCNEMDIWEANGRAQVFTPHVCAKPGSFLCAGEECYRTEAGSGVCDKDGCGINPYGLGDREFYGPRGSGVDTTRPFEVVTRFVTGDGTDEGELVAIERAYVQRGRVVENTRTTTNERVLGMEGGYQGKITQGYCEARNTTDFVRLGGMKAMGESLRRGMVLVFSIWNSEGDFMDWLDGGEGRNGPCNATEGDPALIKEKTPDVSVTFSNVRWGEIGSTVNVRGGGPIVPAGVEALSVQSSTESKAAGIASRVGVVGLVLLISSILL